MALGAWTASPYSRIPDSRENRKEKSEASKTPQKSVSENREFWDTPLPRH